MTKQIVTWSSWQDSICCSIRGVALLLEPPQQLDKLRHGEANAEIDLNLEQAIMVRDRLNQYISDYQELDMLAENINNE